MSDLLPSNATSQERSISLAIERDVSVPIRDLWNPDTCPVELLPWLAWALSVDEWNAAWTEEQKRAVVKSSIEVHRHKGTIGAIRSSLGSLFSGSRVQEWFNQTPKGEKFTFRVLLDIDQAGVDPSLLRSVEMVINHSKNLRSHLERVELTVSTSAGTSVAAIALIGEEVHLNNYIWPATVINRLAFIV